MASLAEIRARLAENQNRTTPSNYQQDNTIYPHWNIPEGKEAVVRFLPDANNKNVFFWVERAMIRLPFPGVSGESDTKPVVVQVPCVEMYNDGSTCPILAEVRPWFKDKSLEDMGKKYWKKRSYIFQGFVVEDPMKEENPPENPIRKFVINSQIYQLIRSSILDPELEELPTDYMRGIDFRINKITSGGHSNYTTSKWSRRERALNEAERAAIDNYGLFDLSSFLPKKPTDAELKIMKEMFEASVNGEPYDLDRWGSYFKPYGVSRSDSSAVTPVRVDTISEDDDVPFDTDTTVISKPSSLTPKEVDSSNSDSASRANEILAMIRNRKQS